MIVCITTCCPNCERYIINYTSLTTSDVVDYMFYIVGLLALSSICLVSQTLHVLLRNRVW